MAVLEVRRHTMRSKPGQHLSQDGISLARYVGGSTGPFSIVVSSEIPRAIETAIAMGFATDYQIEDLGILPEEVFSAVAWPNAFGNMSKIVNEDETCQRFARKQANRWRAVLGQISDDQAALIVTHGGVIELGAIGFAPDADHAAWGDAVGYCEGFRFTLNGPRIDCEVLRVPEQLRLVLN